jgi:glycosyltransferase involved in cell wall biosynthesis
MDTIGQLGKEAWIAPPGRRVCLLVLGMHRSGTSALARVLSIAGADLPADLMGATAANQMGHWESNKLFRYHDRMLAEFGTAWDDWRAIDYSMVSPARRGEIKAELSAILTEQFSGESPLIVVKDPRICRFAPLFFDALDDAGFDYRCVLAFRSPIEVVESLARRDQIPRGQAGLLWLRHVLDAELAARSKPRAVISYDALLAGWESMLVRLGEQLSVSWPYTPAEIKDQVRAFLSPAQRNHETTVEETLLDPMLRGWIGEVHSALLVLEQNPSSAAALAAMDRVRREFTGAASIIDRLLVDAESRHAVRLQEAAAELAEARREADALAAAHEACADLAADLARRNVENAALSAEIIERRGANIELAARAASQADVISRLQAELAQAHAASDAAEANLEALRAALQGREAELARATEALAAYERPGFRDSVVRPLARWLLEGDFDEDIVEREQFVDWLLPNFQNSSTGEVWSINPNGAELAELMKLINAESATKSAPARDTPPTRRLLLVSEYAPSFAHAGGLRVRDLYAEIKRIRPDLETVLYCPSAPDIDGDVSWLNDVFDEVHLTAPEQFSFVDFVRRAGRLRRYDIVDCQFHKAGRMLSQFVSVAERSLFTPMECIARSTYEQARSGFRRDNSIHVRDVLVVIRSTLDELRIVSSADETVCVSDADAAFLQKLAPWRRIGSMPTGLSDSEFADQLAPDFQPTPPSAKPQRLVYAAYFGSNTNRVGLAWFLDHVHPHILCHCPDYKLAVVGRGDLSTFIESKPENVTFIGEVPVMPPVLAQARAGLALALHGSGFRGKINQYAVCGLPAVSTSLGITGLAYTPGVDILTADDPQEFALSCVRVLTDNAYADEVALKARATALANYRWDANREKICQIYRL